MAANVTNGNKADNLLKLQAMGCNVPKFLIVTDGQDFDHTQLQEDQFYAVRSSATSEDGADTSGAGMYESVLGVKPADVPEAITQVRPSYLEGAVIVQECIASTSAGVCFTDAGEGTMLVEANFGMCTTVVAGANCDAWQLDATGKAKDFTIVHNKESDFLEDGVLVKKNTESAPSLKDSQIQKVFSECKKIEAEFGAPQDIEFCFKHDTLYILQARPITQKIFEEEIFYDSSNIAESYSGIVLPLTFSFAQEIYSRVYQDLLVASGVSKKIVEKHAHIFENMLGHFYGRFYYNMNNWYRMMAFLPGYDRNKQNLEQMISSSVQADIEKNIAPSLWLKIKYPFLVVWKVLWLPHTVAAFTKDMHKLLADTEKGLAQSPDISGCKALYANLQKHMLTRWYVTVENDFLVMTYFGALKKLVPDEKSLVPFLQFENVSAQQIHMLTSLGSHIFSKKDWADLYDQQKLQELDESIHKDQETLAMLQQYSAIYGGRFANELKLESPDVSEHTELLISTLHTYAHVQKDNVFDQKRASIDLPFFKKILFKFCLKRFKKYASQRERLRLLRSKAFSTVRRIFIQTGKSLHANNQLDSADDVFYVSIEESFSGSSLQIKVAERKKEYAGYKDLELHPHFSCRGVPTKVHTLREGFSLDKNSLYGRGCVPGVVTGKVHVLEDFAIPDDREIEIIVAKHTDPGWTPLIGMCKGMIIEQGGLLSHASIVARELGIPTVIGAYSALKILEDGQTVTLDGSEGTVVIL